MLTMVGLVLVFGKFYASFARDHKALRSYANPTYYIYSATKYVNGISGRGVGQFMAAIGPDATIPATDIDRELIIMVVGESARADRFSLNGHQRDTNPRLREAGAISFTDFWACGTSTAVSVPCMFSMSGSTRSSAHPGPPVPSAALPGLLAPHAAARAQIIPRGRPTVDQAGGPGPPAWSRAPRGPRPLRGRRAVVGDRAKTDLRAGRTALPTLQRPPADRGGLRRRAEAAGELLERRGLGDRASRPPPEPAE